MVGRMEQSSVKISSAQERRLGLAAKVLALNTPGSHKGASSNPGSSTSHPAPSCDLGEFIRGRPRALEPCTLVGYPEEVPGSWLWLGIALAVAVTWGVDHWTEDLPLCLSSSPYI